jgi:hypothetical protein
MRIRTILAAAAAPAALAAVVLGTTGTAFASTGTATNGQAGHITGNQATSYNDPYFGGVQCNEVQHPAFDNVTCKFVSGPTGSGWTVNAQNLQTGATGTVQWNSDFGTAALVPNGIQQFASHTNPGTLTWTATGPAGGAATGYTGQVTYTN